MMAGQGLVYMMAGKCDAEAVWPIQGLR
jgi:hypothetical protein